VSKQTISVMQIIITLI